MLNSMPTVFVTDCSKFVKWNCFVLCAEYDPKYGHNWPVLEHERNCLDLTRDKLPALLIPIYFNWLQNINVLKQWHVNLILSKPSLEAKCDALLNILKRGNRNDFSIVTNFLEAYQGRSL